MTVYLLALSAWLTSKQITHVAMESTGEFWKPIYNLLEGNFELLVVNGKHIKNVPGRKTDVKDAEWIAELLRWADIKLSSVATDVTGVSARAMLKAIVQDQVDPAALSELARGRLHKKRDALEQALNGKQPSALRDRATPTDHRFPSWQHATGWT